MLGLATTAGEYVDNAQDIGSNIYTLTQIEADPDSHHSQPPIEQSQRASQHRSSLFLSEVQAQASYELVDEWLFATEHSDSIYHHAPPLRPWFLQSSANKNRLNGWKDGNNLYSSRITYYS